MRIVNIATAKAKSSKESQSETPGAICSTSTEPGVDIATSDSKDCDVIERRIRDARAPRYTSYPTADRFVEAFGPDDYARHLAARSFSGSNNLSLYVHIPFCVSLCYYCACNKTITQDKSKSRSYVGRLLEELELVDQHLGGERQLTQLHWGGGTPTFLSSIEIQELMHGLRTRFDFSERSELSIEIDPRSVDDEKMDVLAAEGFNRMSLGIQDFDSDVQTAINRLQPVELTEHVLQRSRSLGFKSTNFDLIYGLPQQTVTRFRQTIEVVVAMRPERVALYNYAHMPARFGAQRLINEADLPSVDEKIAIFDMGCERLEKAGYVYIGMDHFALPDDELAVAHRTGCLHRNFQGYSTQPDNDLIALGSSAISHVGTSYSQNRRGVNDYMGRILQGTLATQRGIELDRDDVLRRSIIMAVMCQGDVCKKSVEIAHLIDFDEYFARELKLLQPLVDEGFVELTDDAVTVTETGRRQTLRLIAGVFDRYLQEQLERSAYSRVL